MKKLVRIIILVLASTPVVFIFQNCGQAGQITAQNADTVLGQPTVDEITLIANPSLVIDGGAEFTNSKNIILKLSAIGAEEMQISESPSCESEQPWERFSETKPWVLSDENRLASVYVKFRKIGAPETECVSDGIIHDNIAPSITTVAAPPAFTNQLNSQLQYAVVENGSGVRAVTCRDQLSVTLPCVDPYYFSARDKEGTISVTLQAIDKAGNVSEPLTVSTVVDVTAPVITINGSGGAIALPNADFKISIVESNGLKAVQCRLYPTEAAFKDCKDLNINYTNLASGLYSFEVQAEDLAGNKAQAQQALEVDLSVPMVIFTSLPEAISRNRNASFEFRGVSGAKVLSKFKCSLDMGPYAACTSPANFANLADKNYIFRVIGTNDVNVDSTAAEHRFIVDTVAPALRVVTRPEGILKVNTAQITLSAEDLNGIRSLECSLDGAAYSDCSIRTVNLKDLDEGSHNFMAKAVDNAGNVSTVGPVVWSVDTTPESRAMANLSSNPTLEGLQTKLQVSSVQVSGLSYSCLGQYSKNEIAKGSTTLSSFEAPILVNEDFTCLVKGLDKAKTEISITVAGQVNCGNRIKSQGRCVDFVCTKFTKLEAVTNGILNIPARSAGECFTYKLFNAIPNSSSALTKVKDTEVISRNHDSSNPRIHNPYSMGRAQINFKLGGPRVVKLTGGDNSLSPIRVDNFVLSGIYPAQVPPLPSHYSAHGTKDSTSDSAQTHVLFQNSPINLKTFGAGGTATVTPLEIVKEADSNLNYILDVRALDCGGSRELSEIHLVFQ